MRNCDTRFYQKFVNPISVIDFFDDNVFLKGNSIGQIEVIDVRLKIQKNFNYFHHSSEEIMNLKINPINNHYFASSGIFNPLLIYDIRKP